MHREVLLQHKTFKHGHDQQLLAGSCKDEEKNTKDYAGGQVAGVAHGQFKRPFGRLSQCRGGRGIKKRKGTTVCS